MAKEGEMGGGVGKLTYGNDYLQKKEKNFID